MSNVGIGAQRVTPVLPAGVEDQGSAHYTGTPFGTDANVTSHVQPAPTLKSRGGLTGEQEDPRLC